MLARNYRGSALLQLGDLDGRTALLDSVAAARELGQHEYVMRGYYNLAEGLWRLGRHAEAARYLDAADEYGRDRDFQAHSYFVDGPAAAAAADARGVGAGRGRCCGACSPSAPTPACSAARRCRCWRGCWSAGRRRGAAAAGRGRPRGPGGRRPGVAGAHRPGAPRARVARSGVRRARTGRGRRRLGRAAAGPAPTARGAAHYRGELLRWLRRLGRAGHVLPGLPAGVRGGHRRRLAGGRRGVGAGRRPLRAGPGAAGVG